MLTQYQTRTAQLLQNPQAPTALYSTTDITSWVNQARGQLAGESKAIRRIGNLTLAQGTAEYNFSAITLTNNTGVSGVIAIRQVMLVVASGYAWMRPRPFEWFTLYRLNNPVPVQGPPNEWAQFGQGAAPQSGVQAAGGSLYVNKVPDQPYTLWLDCICYPTTLVDDTTAEAIPYLWTDAVPYFAAYLALLSAQSQARTADAERMFNRYQEFTNRARAFSTPDVLPGIYPQNPSPVRQNQLGIQPARQGGGQ